MLASINLWACRSLRFTPRGISLFSAVPLSRHFLRSLQVSSSKVIITRMEYSALTNEVFRHLLAQNNLPITGSREELFARLGTIQVDMDSPHCTRSSDASENHQNRRVLARVLHPLLLPHPLSFLTTHPPTTRQLDLLTQTTSPRTTLRNIVAATGAFLQMPT